MKSLAKITAFIVSFAAVIAALHFVLSFLFGQDPGLLLHHGAGQFTFYALFILNVVIYALVVYLGALIFALFYNKMASKGRGIKVELR